MSTENKKSFFSITLRTAQLNPYQKSCLEEDIDVILGSLSADASTLKFEQNNNEYTIFFFKCNQRKRKGQISKLCEKTINPAIDFKIESYTKESFYLGINRLQKNDHYTWVNLDPNEHHYNESDIKFLDDTNTWHSWQKQLYYSIFDSTDKNRNLIEPDKRKIIFLYCPIGASGKSSFFKWMTRRNPQITARLSMGNAAQLRSSLINIGPKKIYLVDLARSKGEADSYEDLLSALEDLKSGAIFSAMYGGGRQLLMEPPHIIVSSNFVFRQDLLSKDRWMNFIITKIGSDIKLKRLAESEIKKLLEEQEERHLFEIEKKKFRQKLIRAKIAKEFRSVKS